jgi:hypothetical protein
VAALLEVHIDPARPARGPSIGRSGEIVLGPPIEHSAANIDKYN